MYEESYDTPLVCTRTKQFEDEAIVWHVDDVIFIISKPGAARSNGTTIPNLIA